MTTVLPTIDMNVQETFKQLYINSGSWLFIPIKKQESFSFKTIFQFLFKISNLLIFFYKLFIQTCSGHCQAIGLKILRKKINLSQKQDVSKFLILQALNNSETQLKTLHSYIRANIFMVKSVLLRISTVYLADYLQAM